MVIQWLNDCFVGKAKSVPLLHPPRFAVDPEVVEVPEPEPVSEQDEL